MTLRELAMLQAMNAITEKDNWESKVFDDAIKARWRDELLSGEEVGWSDKMFAWMIAELQHKAIISKADRLVTAFDADVVKSDLAVPEATRQALMTAVKPLEDIPEVGALFPFVFIRSSRILVGLGLATPNSLVLFHNAFNESQNLLAFFGIHAAYS